MKYVLLLESTVIGALALKSIHKTQKCTKVYQKYTRNILSAVSRDWYCPKQAKQKAHKLVSSN